MTPTALRFRLPAGAAEPVEPYEPLPADPDLIPETALQLGLARVAGVVVELVEAIDRGVRRKGEDYRADDHAVLARADRAAEALATTVAAYRARRPS